MVLVFNKVEITQEHNKARCRDRSTDVTDNAGVVRETATRLKVTVDEGDRVTPPLMREGNGHDSALEGRREGELSDVVIKEATGGNHGGNTVLIAVPVGVVGLAAGDRALEVALLVLGEVSFLETDNVMRGEKGTGVSQLSGSARPTRVRREAPDVIATDT